MTDDFDDAIRARLHGAEPVPTGTAHEVLGELRPAMRRARLKRTLAVGSATLSLVALTGIGIAAVANSVAQEPTELDIFNDGDTLPETGSTPTTANALDEQQRTSTTVESPTTVVDTPTTAATTTEPAVTAPTTADRTRPNESADEPPNASPSAPESTAPSEPTITSDAPAPATTSAPVPSVDPPAPATTSPPAPATTAAPSSVPATTAPATSQPPASNPPSSGQQTIQSNCGSITVSYSGNNISLAGTQPATGFAHEVKKSGPDEVEVEFEAGDTECEITAWVDDGVLRTEVEND